MTLYIKKAVETAGQKVSGTAILALIPIITFIAYKIGGETALIVTSAALSFTFALIWRLRLSAPWAVGETDALTGTIMRDGLIQWADAAIPLAAKANREVAIIAITIDDLEELEERFGRDMRNKVVEETAARLRNFVRDDDIVARVNPGFAIGLRNVRAPETENLLQLSRRLQSLFDDPFSDGPARTYCSVSIGIASECHIKGTGGDALLAGALRACELSAVSGPGSIRIYSEGLISARATERDLAREISTALETGEIFAWFQPQIEAATGKISGFEALARWEHPERGLIAPGGFLDDVEKAGLSQRLAEVILKQSLTALNAWDAAGFHVPRISVNFSNDELRNPRLPDYVRWELDRHNLEPNRLVVEVLESVVADSSEDVISRTLNALSRTGCLIDLDDFGTGFTSFINIRRFNVGRLKIDRSIVNHVDKDADQYKMVAALNAFSRELGIETLAEGVESQEEADTLQAIGCQELQGYHISRPMPLGETLLWLEDHRPAVAEVHRIRSVT